MMTVSQLMETLSELSPSTPVVVSSDGIYVDVGGVRLDDEHEPNLKEQTPPVVVITMESHP